MRTKKVKLSKIISWYASINGRIENYGLKEDHLVLFPRDIYKGDNSNISLLTSKFKKNAEKLLSQTNCKVIVTSQDVLDSINSDKAKLNKAFLVNENPKEIIIQYCKFFLELEQQNQGQYVHLSAVIEKGAKLGKNNYIGANVFISKNSQLGDNCYVGANTVIKNTKVGNFVKMGSNNTIGGDGFGYTKSKNKEVNLFPHFGNVLINDNVHIGNNNCIDRGSLSDTIIKKGVKIDNLVHVAHNVIVGENSFIIACSMIAGSVEIDDNSWISPSSSIRNNIKIGKNTLIGMGSVVTKDVNDKETVLGNPAKEISEFKKILKQQKK